MATKPKDRLETAVATAKTNGTAPLPEAKLKQLYATMLKCRTSTLLPNARCRCAIK